MSRDETLNLLREGYGWAPRVRAGANAAATRVAGRPAVVVGGPEGVRRFYDPRLRRRGAIPQPVKQVLFGAGAVHGLDDDRHRRRKALLLQVLGPTSVDLLGQAAEREWEDAAQQWAGRDVVLFDEAVRVISRTVLPWAGVPAYADVPWVGRALADVVDGFATPGRPYLRAVAGRARLDRWATGIMRAVRDRDVHVDEGTAVAVLARAYEGTSPMPAKVAGVELLNVVRPTVAVAWFVTWAGLRLAEHPEWRARVREDEAALDAFVQEVRRLHPFVPVLAAKARARQDVLGHPLRRGGLVVLDVHGTDHDPVLWPDPDAFRPERFLDGQVERDALVPQGGGDVVSGHRCPGEQVTMVMLQVAVARLARVAYSMPEQDLTVDMTRMPTLPRSGVVIEVADIPS